MNHEHALMSSRRCEQPLDRVRSGEPGRTFHTLVIRGRTRALWPFLAVTVLVLVLGVDRATAQDTRAATIREQQAGKQSVVAPPSANRAEAIIDRLDDWGFFTGELRGLYPWLGTVFPGGGVAAGAGVRKPLGDDGAINVFGGSSFSRFWRADAEARLPTFARNRARITLSGSYVDAPDVRYHGVGNDTLKDHQTRYGYAPASGGARLDVAAAKYVSLGGGVKYLDIDTSRGRTGLSIEQRFSPADTPALDFDNFSYINSTAYAALDWRRPAGYSGSGGLYRVQLDDYHDRYNDGHSFRTLEAEARQLIPLLRANWVLALRGLATVTDIDDRSVVPYFMLPSLGGGTNLRGYPDFRFRDRHRLAMNAELRWTPARFMDMAVFYDTGKVASRRKDLDLDDLKQSYGIGMRIVGPNGYAFRLEVAHSREHSARLLVGAGGTF